MKLRYFFDLRIITVIAAIFTCFEGLSIISAQSAAPIKNPNRNITIRKSMGHSNNMTLKGNITIPGHQDKMPEFRIYFDGRETFSNQEGFYSLPVEEEDFNEYSFLICKGLQQNFEKNNTIKNLVMFTNKGYKYFVVKKNMHNNAWEWEAQKLTSGDFVVPLKTIVVVMDPTEIDHIEHWDITLPCNFIALPRIILKQQTKPKLTTISTKSLLYSLDLKPFHETIREEKKAFANGKGQCSLTR